MINSISANLITFNESHRIYDTLFKLCDHVDEIVIVDQSSTDNTVEEIHRFADDFDIYINVLTDPHHGFCEMSRERAFLNSRGDWILVLDADEEISEEFVCEMRTLDEKGFLAARLKRSLWIGNEHRFSGDFQYRLFQRDRVKFLKHIHTEPQPFNINESEIYSPEYVGIYHRKTWQEQISDETNYEKILSESNDPLRDAKLALNVHLQLLRDKGISAEEADSMSIEERNERGIGAG